MQNQHTFTICSDVHMFITNFNATEIQANELSDNFVMIAGYKNNFGTFLGFFHHQLNYVIVRLMPVPTTLKLPTVDDVAD